MAEIDWSPSCGPQANAHPPPPIAHAPTPIGVKSISLLPSCVFCISSTITKLTHPTKLRAAVIGSGPNGLAAALLLILRYSNVKAAEADGRDRLARAAEAAIRHPALAFRRPARGRSRQKARGDCRLQKLPPCHSRTGIAWRRRAHPRLAELRSMF